MPKSDALRRIRPTVIIGDPTVFQLVAELTKCLYRTANVAIGAYRTSLHPFNRVKYLSIGLYIVMIYKLLLTIIFIALVLGIIALLKNTFKPR